MNPSVRLAWCGVEGSTSASTSTRSIRSGFATILFNSQTTVGVTTEGARRFACLLNEAKRAVRYAPLLRPAPGRLLSSGLPKGCGCTGPNAPKNGVPLARERPLVVEAKRPVGYALVASEFIKVMNDKTNAQIPEPDFADVRRWIPWFRTRRSRSRISRGCSRDGASVPFVGVDAVAHQKPISTSREAHVGANTGTPAYKAVESDLDNCILGGVFLTQGVRRRTDLVGPQG
jgi:hypothetical protein